jgi:hypothetical protein
MVGPSLGSSLVVGGAEGSPVVGVPDGTRLTLGEADGLWVGAGLVEGSRLGSCLVDRAALGSVVGSELGSLGSVGDALLVRPPTTVGALLILVSSDMVGSSLGAELPEG